MLTHSGTTEEVVWIAQDSECSWYYGCIQTKHSGVLFEQYNTHVSVAVVLHWFAFGWHMCLWC